MSADGNKQIVRRYLEQVVSAGDARAAEELVAPEVVFTSPYTPEPTRGLHAFRQMITSLRASFPDLRIEEHDVIAEDDRVATRWTASGTHTGAPFAGIPTSGRRFSITGISIYRVRNGRIIEGWVNDDSLGMMSQLGAIPAAQ